MAEKVITLSNMKYIIDLMHAYFFAPFARKLVPGARINGIVFNGTADVEVASSPMKNVELCSGKTVSVCFNSTSNARMVMTGKGLGFYDGTNLTELLSVSENADGTYTIKDNINGGSITTGKANSSASDTTETTSAKQAIGFKTDSEA